MKTHRLQAAFARKREVEHLRTERTAAVDRYYVHWGKVTSKYENWTAPEYYKQAEDTIRKTKENTEKTERLKMRQEKLRDLLMREKIDFEEQLANLRRPKSRNISKNVMEKIDQNFKAKQGERRRLELEAKLYGRWRHGVDDESLLYESKSNNQVLAKLNWLDKQIEDQVQREEEEKFSRNQTLRLQEEVRITEERHKERQEIREKEIKEIRALQEKHIQELKEREHESESLKLEASYIQNSLDQINAELTSLGHYKLTQFNEAPLSHNVRKIKMIIRKRSEEFREQLSLDINMLKRINTICSTEKEVFCLIDKLQKQYDTEMQNVEQIESMYESEAKVNLRQCEELWGQLSYERHLDIANLLKDIQNKLSNKLYENQQRQKEVFDIRTTHIISIENSNDKLKLLVKEHKESQSPLLVETPRSVREEPQKSIHKVSESFTNLNLDCLSGSELGCQLPSSRSQLAGSPDSTNRPKFGRKKVAWV